MNIFRKMAGFFIQRLDITDPQGWQPYGGGMSDAGEMVTDTSAMALSAVWGCVNLIAGSIGSLPFSVRQRSADGGSAVVENHPVHELLHDSPNADQTAMDYGEFQNIALEMRGNCYARKVRNAAGTRIIALDPIHPDLVSVRRLTSGALEYAWTKDGKSYRAGEDEVFHIRGFGGNPLGGLSTIQYARRTFGLAQAIGTAASSSFKNSVRPSGALMFKNFLPADKREAFKQKLYQDWRGAKATGEPMLLEGGAEWHPLSLSAQDMQMIELGQFSTEEICRFFGVPPLLIGHSSKTSTWPTSHEQLVLLFIKFCLRRRIERIEQASMKWLLSPQERAKGLFIEANMEALLRGDSVNRASFYQTMTNIGAMTLNEVRRLENLPPVEGGDVIRLQMQNVPINQTGKDTGNAQ